MYIPNIRQLVVRLSYLFFIFTGFCFGQSVWEWRSPPPQGNDLNFVIHGNGQFVAVGDCGTVLTSPDGTTWTMKKSGTTKVLLSVIFGKGKFVAVGESGTILTSPDGMVWTKQISGIMGTLSSVTYGNNHLVAVGWQDTVLTSSNGTNWTINALDATVA